MVLDRSLALLAIAALTLFACTPTGPVGAPTSRPTSSDSATEEVAYLAEEMRDIHPRLFHSISRSDFLERTRELEATAATLGPDALLVEVARLAASVSRDGGDGHTGLFIFDQSEDLALEMFPLRLYLFTDGVYVVDAMEPYQGLIGQRVVAVGGTPIDEVIDRVTPLISKDNDQTVLSRLPWFLVWAEALTETGVSDATRSTTFTVRIEDVETIQEIDSVPMEEYAEWAGIWHPMIPARLPMHPKALYLKNADRDIWMTYLRDEDAIYLQYNVTMVGTAPVARRLTKLARAHPAAKVIVDLRHNPGGDTGTSRPLSAALTRPPLRDRQLILLVGRGTFSAAAIFADRVLGKSDAQVVGEPIGASRIFYGDPRGVRMYESDLYVEVSAIRWQMRSRGDRDQAVPIDVVVRPSSKDFFAHRDPVLATALDL